ncbi:MAG TPA: hypothetical protein VFR75_08785 [Solirubrobacterales bacterium]|nr:hypothetical protein [Solirubrobacterales bacterium]
MNRIRPHLTYANVMVTLLAFVVLGGVGYAATALPKNSVGAKQLKKNAVTAAKIKAGAVNGAKVRDGSLSGADVDASTLAQVPSARSALEAQNAVRSTTAQSAETAKNAEQAASAESAERLGKFPPAAFAPAGRFRFESRPNGAIQQEIFQLPGGVRVLTSGNSNLNLAFDNTGSEIWRVSTPTEGGEVEPGEEVVALVDGFTALILIQNTVDPSEAVALQCGRFDDPDRIGCFATMSPELGVG